jgi:hypothetical protein
MPKPSAGHLGAAQVVDDEPDHLGLGLDAIAGALLQAVKHLDHREGLQAAQADGSSLVDRGLGSLPVLLIDRARLLQAYVQGMNDYLACQIQQIDRAKTFAGIRRIEDQVTRMGQAIPEVRRGSAWLLRALGRRPRPVASDCTAS